MSWNHRVMRAVDPDGTHVFTIHEVYYDETGAIKAWSSPTSPMGTTLNDLHGELTQFERAFTRHVLDVRGEELYDIGLTGRTRKEPVCVFKPDASPQTPEQTTD